MTIYTLHRDNEPIVFDVLILVLLKYINLNPVHSSTFPASLHPSTPPHLFKWLRLLFYLLVKELNSNENTYQYVFILCARESKAATQNQKWREKKTLTELDSSERMRVYKKIRENIYSPCRITFIYTIMMMASLSSQM